MKTTEKAARKLLGIPAFPDTATGPASGKLLAQINADLAKLGDAKALERWARHCTVAYAGSVDDDAAYVKAACGQPVKPGDPYPVGAELAAVAKDPEKRRKCSAQELAALDAAVSAAPKPAEVPK